MKNKEKIKREHLIHISKRTNVTWKQSLLVKAIALVAAFLFVGILSWICIGASPISVYSSMVKGVFSSGDRFLTTWRTASVLLIISIAVTPAFKMKFWNIGAEGQVLISALAAFACMYKLGGKIPEWLLICIMLISSLLVGALWAVIPAIFKALWNTNETLFTLMTNYIATQIVLYFVDKWAPNNSTSIHPIFDHGNLPKIGGGDFWLTIIVGLIITVLIYIYLKFSKHGYEISVVGESTNTAKYIGLSVKKVIIRTLILSGALCGVAGFLLAGSICHTISDTVVNGLGFTAVMVSWLAKFNPLIMIAVSFLVIFLKDGTGQVMSDNHITNNFFANMIVAIVFFFIIGCEFFISYKINLRKSAKREAVK